jgi:uncharacterized protein
MPPGRGAASMSMSCKTIDLQTGTATHIDDVLLNADPGRVCRDCATSGKTCCQEHDIYVTWGDCRRIYETTKQKDFYEYRGCSNADYADQDDDPLWQQWVFRPDGTRRVLKRRANGDCLFLTPSGCSLALTARPLVCRLYPHTYSAVGLDNCWDRECPAVRSSTAAVIESSIAGVARRDAAQWHQLLYHEVLWERSGDDNWINV